MSNRRYDVYFAGVVLKIKSEFYMFIKSIKRNYLKVLTDESIPEDKKIDALLMKLGGEFLVSKDDRVYIFEKDGVTAKFDAKHARDFSFKDYICKDMNKLFHDF